MKVTYLGTTMLLFDDGRDQILFDCHVTRPSLLTSFAGKLETNAKVAEHVIKQAKMDRVKAIFISHSHHDHVMDLPYFAHATGAEVYGSLSAANVARGGNVAEEHIHIFQGGETISISDFEITVLPSLHSKAHWYNNDLGQVITEPVRQPAPKKAYKEGGSYDFLVKHCGKTYLIRPSYNFIEGQLDGIKADVLFLGIAGISKDSKERKKKFFAETCLKVQPNLVIPLHWDNFFTPLYGEIMGQPRLMENTGKSIHILSNWCLNQGIDCLVQPPLSSITL